MEGSLRDVREWNTVLKRFGTGQLRPEVERYFNQLEWSFAIRGLKRMMMVLFATLFLEFQIRAWFPTDYQLQAWYALGIGVGLVTIAWLIERFVFVYIGDPQQLRKQCETADEENAIAHTAEQKLLGHVPRLIKEQVGVGSMFTTADSNTVLSNLQQQQPQASTDNNIKPLASISTLTPRSPLGHIHVISPPPSGRVSTPTTSSPLEESTDETRAPPKIRGAMANFHAYHLTSRAHSN